MLQLLTPTGARPESWELCVKWMESQDYQGKVRWVIVDDGPTPQKVPTIPGWEILVIYPTPVWKPGQNTQVRNLLEGLNHVDPNYPLLIIEDDEHYKPEWLSHCSAALQEHDLVGQFTCRKYSVKLMRARDQSTHGRSSLCCTGMKGEMVKNFRRILTENPKLPDVVLWERYPGHQFPGHWVTGIKCMPGRAGIDSGHSPRMVGTPDPMGLILRRWIGQDAELYLRYSKLRRKQVRTNRDQEISLYVKAYQKPEYRMGLRRHGDVKRILSGLPRGRLLDVGTGRGETLQLAQQLGYSDVLGTEVVPDLLRENVVYAISRQLPFEDKSFDVVTCFDVLEHLIEEDLIPTVQEFARVARSCVIISASERPSVYDGVDLHISKRPKAEWVKLLVRALPNSHVQDIGMAGGSPAFMVSPRC